MKKQRVIIIVSAIAFCIALGNFIINEIILKSVRYSTAIESFSESSSKDSELVEIVEDRGIALVIYKNKNDGVFSDNIIVKESRGWTPLTVHYSDLKTINLNNGLLILKEIDNKYVIEISAWLENNEKTPTVSDSSNSIFWLNSFASNGNRNLFYAFLVLDELPNNYKIYYNDKEIEVGE